MLTEVLSKRIRLSNNFTLWEFLRSSQAVKYGLMSLQFVIDWIDLVNLQTLCIKCLEPLREHMNCAITVTSGFRSQTLNGKTKGSAKSHHMRAMAADIVCEDLQKAFEFLKTLTFTQLIWEEAIVEGVLVKWIHISYDPNDLRCEILIFEDNKYTKIQ